MPIDVQQPPMTEVTTEHPIFTKHSLFASIYKPPIYDVINVNVYQDFAYSRIVSGNYLVLATGVNVVLDHVFEFGPFCTYLVDQTIKTEDTVNTNSELYLNSYFYCGNMFAYVPLADKPYHPKIFLDIGLGNAHGLSQNKTNKITVPVNYVFAVIKPAVALEMNFLSFLQWTLGLQYRIQIQLGGGSQNFGWKASGIEISTGPVFQF